jgi:hypothetical protein
MSMAIPKPDPLPVQTECAAKLMLVDLKLIQRIEDTIAAERSAFADGMAALRPGSGARWLPVAGGRAIFTGADFFSNRALAMGLRGPVSHDDLERIETFYAECGVASEVEIASMVDRSLLRALNQRGYQLLRFRNIYAQTLHPRNATGTAPAARSGAVEMHTVDASTALAWSTTLLDGFGYTRDTDRDRVEAWNQMIRSLPGVTALVAVMDGQPVGAASIMVLGASAMLGGAATLAVVTADPGSSSGRNAERTGFQLICNHVSMCVPAGSRADRSP